MTVAKVNLWGRAIGAVSIEPDREYAAFQYEPAFVGSGIQVAPMMMPPDERVYEFPELARTSFHGLPGLLADSLPDKFGNALIDAWLVAKGRSPGEFNAVERLCYIGNRGMGALEFEPGLGFKPRASTKIDIDALVNLASMILNRRQAFRGSFDDAMREHTLGDMLRVGTSAGGARAKAVIAWHPGTHEVRSGQTKAAEGFEYWLLKFDGVSGNADKELEDPQGFGVIEYAYSLMAKAAGIEMSECRLLEENGRRHFMTKRFDRFDTGEKLHMQSLAALMHFDFNQAGAYSYEQALQTIRRLALPMNAIEQQFRRMVFNIVARNQDDHVKNIAFLMNKKGQWSLAPAFDVAFSYNPSGLWTSQHQMTLNGKRDGFAMEDFIACEKFASMKRGRAAAILEEVIAAVRRWPEFAEQAGLSGQWTEQIRAAHRLEFG